MPKFMVISSTIGCSRADGQTGEARFHNRRINHPLRTKPLDEPLADLEGALVTADFFTD